MENLMKKFFVLVAFISSFNAHAFGSFDEVHAAFWPVQLGEKVITPHGYEAQVVDINGNLAKIEYLEGVSVENPFSLSSLYRTRGCTYDGFCVGDSVEITFGGIGDKSKIAGVLPINAKANVLMLETELRPTHRGLEYLSDSAWYYPIPTGSVKKIE